MFNVLIADDNSEDRELLKLEITRALSAEEPELVFFEASSIKQAKLLLNSRFFDLMTMDIEFDRLNEGIDALPEIFDSYPTLNIIVISGRLNKAEVSEQLFRFTRENVLKGKRWTRHFDVLDKKDDKTEALRRAYSFSFKQKEMSGSVRELFLLAESYLERDMIDKCLEIYQRIQLLAPGERESHENIQLFKGVYSIEQALEYMKKGEKVVASLLLGHYLEKELKFFTKKLLGYNSLALSDCFRDLRETQSLSRSKQTVFQQLMLLRNKAIHHPSQISEEDFPAAVKKLNLLVPDF